MIISKIEQFCHICNEMVGCFYTEVNDRIVEHKYWNYKSIPSKRISRKITIVCEKCCVAINDYNYNNYIPKLRKINKWIRINKTEWKILKNYKDIKYKTVYLSDKVGELKEPSFNKRPFLYDHFDGLFISEASYKKIFKN